MIFLLALPAILSPLILMPLPDSWGPLPDAVRPVVTVCTYPQSWASAASLVAVLWVAYAPASSTRKIVGAVIAILAWIPAWNTASTLAAWEHSETRARAVSIDEPAAEQRVGVVVAFPSKGSKPIRRFQASVERCYGHVIGHAAHRRCYPYSVLAGEMRTSLGLVSTAVAGPSQFHR